MRYESDGIFSGDTAIYSQYTEKPISKRSSYSVTQ